MKVVSLACCSFLVAAAAGAAPARKAPPAAKADPGLVTGQALLNGKPAAGARVFLFWAEPASRGWREMPAGPGGEFRFAVRPDPRQHLALVAAAPSGDLGWAAVQTAGKARKPTPVQLTLKPTATLTGRVLTREGQGHAGETVRITGVQPPGWPPGADGLPPALLSALVTRTGADGTFRLSGLPFPAVAGLAFESRAEPLPISVVAREQATGVVVRSPDVRLRLRAEPAQAATAWLRLLRSPAPGPLAAVLRRRSGLEPVFRPVEVDAQGAVEEKLAPGHYQVGFQGTFRQVEVAADQELTLAGARGPLRLELKDDAGRAASGAGIVVNTEAGPWPPVGRPATANAEGVAELSDFPWDSPRVTIRVGLGSLEGNWSGDPRTLKSPLALSLKRAASVSVRGRLVLDGKPLLNARVALFVRDGATRRGFAAGKTDGAGWFEIPGVRPGLVFQVGIVLDALPGQVLESPPLTAPAGGERFETGDVKVAVSADTAGGEVQARHYLPIPRTTPAEEEAAEEALFRYLDALRQGDAAGAHTLTSTLDPLYDPALPAFLQSARLTLPGAVAALKREEVRAVRFYPGILLAGMYDAGADVGLEELSEAMHRPDWVLLAARAGAQVRRVGLMHREAGGWKLLAGLPVDGAGGLNAVAGDHPLFGAAYPDAPAEAAGAGAAFLKAWAGGPEKVRPLLSARAPEKPAEAAGFADRWSARVVPSLRNPSTPVGEAGLTEWDLAMLFTYPQGLQYLQSGAQGQAPRADLRAFPYPQIRSRDLAVLGYVASEQRYLMLLVREAGQWKVLEPALPAGPD